nr:hypothetical protein CFP56_32152 [Quercus suber]
MTLFDGHRSYHAIYNFRLGRRTCVVKPGIACESTKAIALSRNRINVYHGHYEYTSLPSRQIRLRFSAVITQASIPLELLNEMDHDFFILSYILKRWRW